MKILHAYCLNYNIGDYALGIGLKNLLRHFLDVDLIGNTNIQGREFNDYYIKEVVNKRYDLLVIGGGGIIHGQHWPNGWFWLIDIDRIEKINIPFIIYGAGNNYWEDEIFPDKAVKHLKKTIKYSSYFSVRNDGSKKRLLDQTGISTNVVPDPGFHVALNSYYDRPIESPYIVIQLANDKPQHRFHGQSNKNSFIINLRKVVKTLAKNYKIVFAPHVIDDVELCREVANGIENTIIWDFGYFAFDHSDKAISFYKYADFAIAMRGHGQIIPISFNTPVITLENHPKHCGLMQELGLSDYCINISQTSFLNKLLDVIKEVQLKRIPLVEKLSKINVKLWNESEIAFKEISNYI